MIYDILVALKPTYFNMNVDLAHTNISDLVLGDHWDLNTLSRTFGDSSEYFISNLIAIDNDSNNH